METNPGKKAAARLGPLTAHVESFLEGLPATGYGSLAVARRLSIIYAFTRSMPSACRSKISARPMSSRS